MKKILTTTCFSLLLFVLNPSEMKALNAPIEDKQKHDPFNLNLFHQNCIQKIGNLKKEIGEAGGKRLIGSTSSRGLFNELSHAEGFSLEGMLSLKKKPTPENVKKLIDQCQSILDRIKSNYEGAKLQKKKEVEKEKAHAAILGWGGF